jgi:hypothetical protein
MFKYIYLSLLICFILSCSNAPSLNNSEKPDLKFEGISIFKKNATFDQITTQLKQNKVKYFVINPNDEEVYITFHLPFKSCNNKLVLYLPEYNIGTLNLTDVFLVFYKSKLALVRSENNTSWPSGSGIFDLKVYFKKKYLDSLSRNITESELFNETFSNNSDSIILVFDQKKEEIPAASVYSISGFRDRIIPKKKEINQKVYGSPNGKGAVFNSFATGKRFGYIPGGPANKNDYGKNIHDLGLDTEKPKDSIYITSFELRFPNELQKCCDRIENSTIIKEQTDKKIRERKIIEDL